MRWAWPPSVLALARHTRTHQPRRRCRRKPEHRLRHGGLGRYCLSCWGLGRHCPGCWGLDRQRPSRGNADGSAGDRGENLQYYGLWAALKYRAQLAGLNNFHPHLLRHTAASRWLAAGGSEAGPMTLAGWSSRDMLDRYTKATASNRAAAEARNLGLGEI